MDVVVGQVRATLTVWVDCHAVGLAESAWTRNLKLSSTWFDQKTPILLPPKATTDEMSDEALLSITIGPDHVASSVVE